MKKFIQVSLLLLMVFSFLPMPAHADQAESVRVILADKDKHDLIVERKDGRLWLIQHNYLCNSMTTEFPIYLIWNEGKVAQVKVAPNEICKAYTDQQYSGEMTLESRVVSDNELFLEHEARAEWNGRKWLLDYETPCLGLREFMSQKVYLTGAANGLAGAKMVLPGNQGVCAIKGATDEGAAEQPVQVRPPKLEGVEYEARNNQVYFYWKGAVTEKPLYLMSYSRFRLNPSLYPWSSMPNLKVTKSNTLTVDRLANGRKYYFYVATLSADNVPGEWAEVSATPKGPGGLKNNPDTESFEVTVADKGDKFILTWPAKAIARKFWVSLYVNGKPLLAKSVAGTVTEYSVPKNAENLGKGLRFTVRTLPTRPTDPVLFDGVYWVNEAK